jgi:CBS domain-containing protein
MRIADICTRDVIQVGADASLREAAEVMRHRHVGALVVVEQPNGGQVPIGILTDRDIVLSVLAPGVDIDALKVADVMTANLATCRESDVLFDAIRTMRDHGVRRLPVLDSIGGLSGMVAADDIYSALGTHLQELSRALTREQVREMQSRI